MPKLVGDDVAMLHRMSIISDAYWCLGLLDRELSCVKTFTQNTVKYCSTILMLMCTFLTRSTVSTKTTREYEGQEYPYFPLDISSASHPFYTGEQRKTANEGRVASFNKRFGAFASRSKKNKPLSAIF